MLQSVHDVPYQPSVRGNSRAPPTSPSDSDLSDKEGQYTRDAKAWA